jgi:hypothetical protein
VNTAARLMRGRGVAARTEKEFRRATDSHHDRPVAEDVLDRRFEPGAAGRAWATDLTYAPMVTSFVHLA